MKKKLNASGSGNYREESPKSAVVIMAMAVVLVGAPLALANKSIGDHGSQAADVSRYARLAKELNENALIVRDVVKRGVVKESMLVENRIVAAKGPTLITPPVAPTNISEVSRNPNKLDIKLSAIYWSPRDPLVTIDGENYREGDRIKGFTLLEIRKTEVLLRNPAGEKEVLYFYDFLDQ